MSDLSTLEARIQLASKYAAKYDLDYVLICAVCEQESAWNPWAYRYEPAFYQRYIVPMIGLTTTEGMMRATSWGLMQLMGEVARELGFSEPYLSGLCDPDTGIDWGSKKLKQCMDKAQGNVTHALLHWNGGGNPGYPDQVIARMDRYQRVTQV